MCTQILIFHLATFPALFSSCLARWFRVNPRYADRLVVLRFHVRSQLALILQTGIMKVLLNSFGKILYLQKTFVEVSYPLQLSLISQKIDILEGEDAARGRCVCVWGEFEVWIEGRGVAILQQERSGLPDFSRPYTAGQHAWLIFVFSTDGLVSHWTHPLEERRG